jgi:exodeoxyribonuclease VII large subunit
MGSLSSCAGESRCTSREGALYEQFLRTRARLAAEGLFDAAAKRALPPYPSAIGIVTSLAAAALHDVLSSLARRAPHVRVLVYPSQVQGTDAPSALVAAIGLAAARAEVDVLLVCRGGGSLEDLWSFNDERVVRAIRAASMPVVVGVGHETDVTLADLAADLRAPTPTAAAELAAPPRADCIANLHSIERALRRRINDALEAAGQRLDRSAMRIARPDQGVRRHAERLSLMAHRLATHWPQAAQGQRASLARRQGDLRYRVQARLATEQQRVQTLAARLQSLDPARVLARGYAWLTNADGSAVMSVHRLAVGEDLRAVLEDGQADVRVTRVIPGDA